MILFLLSCFRTFQISPLDFVTILDCNELSLTYSPYIRSEKTLLHSEIILFTYSKLKIIKHQYIKITIVDIFYDSRRNI